MSRVDTVSTHTRWSRGQIILALAMLSWVPTLAAAALIVGALS